MMNIKPDLLPCPFCGHEFTKEDVLKQYDCAYVDCPNCLTQGPFAHCSKDPKEAINLWNKRNSQKVSCQVKE